MKLSKAIFGLSIIVMMMAAAQFAFAQAAHVRWNIISVDFVAHTANVGGMASATANDGSYITLTGSGTFVAPAVTNRSLLMVIRRWELACATSDLG